MGKLYSLISALLITLWSNIAFGQTGYEWWLDNDVSSRHSGSVTDGRLDLQVDMSRLPDGLHGFNCRINRSDGTWGSIYRQSILVPSVPPSPIEEVFEYWIDDNNSSKVSGNLSGGGNAYTVNVQNLSEGLHRLNYRVRSKYGEWGSIYCQYFLIPFAKPSPVGKAFEYWIDDDYSGKVTGTPSAGSNAYTVNVQSLSEGLHRLNYRVRDNFGEWGSLYCQYFLIPFATPSPVGKAFEYWIDDNYSGRVSGTPSAGSNAYTVDVQNLPEGIHRLNYRVRDNYGNWGSISCYYFCNIEEKDKSQIIGYRHRINGIDLGFVEVDGGIKGSHSFKVELPEDLELSPSYNGNPIFNGDVISVEGRDSIHYSVQVKSGNGWSAPRTWDFAMSSNFSTTAVTMEINSSHDFAIPGAGEFAAVKFTSLGSPLYFRSTVSAALDLYRNGEKVKEFSEEEMQSMASTELEAGEYYGILHDFSNSESNHFTFHLMDTPNAAPTPEIGFVDGVVTMTCSRADAEIHYTLDESEPSLESTLYEAPFPLNRNALIRAKAFVLNSDIEPSDITEFVVDSYKTATPTGVFDMPSRTMTLSCETEGATISYRIGSAEDWILYEAPFTIGRNCTVYAVASYEGYNDSDVAEIAITDFPDSMAQPEIAFNDGLVTISCERSDAEIRYTIDGSDPTMESTIYTAPFVITRNATIKAIAYIPNSEIDPSEIAVYVVDSYKTATPTGVFDMPSRTMTLSCATDGASISYRIGASGDWTAYTSPFTIGRNCTVYAFASLDGYNDSEVAEIAVTGFPDSMAQPAITFNDGLVTISCERSDAEIRYTIDGSDPTMESTLYTAPFELTHNATVKAIAYIPNSDIEVSDISIIEVDIYKVATPTGVFDMSSRTMTLSCATDGASISYRIGASGDWTAYTSPFTIGRNCTVYAFASLDGYNDSDVAEIAVTGFPDSMAQPAITFNDGLVTISCERSDAEIRYTIDGSDPTMESTIYTAPFAITRNATIKAIAYIPNSEIDPSEIAVYVVDSYKTATPTGVFDMPSRTMTLSCATDGASISYRIGASGDWTAYTSPFTIGRNCTVYAFASLDGFNDSDVAEIAVTGFPDSMAQPAITFNDGLVTISCERSDAEIRYTIDGSDPTMESTLYTAPFAITRNATIKAIAYIPNSEIDPSDIAVYVVDSYKTATPTGVFDMPSRTMTLSCATDGASISYRIGASGDWTAYTSPFTIGRNCTVYAFASLDGYNDSDVAEIAVTGFPDSMAQPEITFNDGLVTISCERSDAEIRYTIDGSDPTMESTLYTAPFAITKNATIKAIAYIPNSEIDPSEIAVYVVDSYKTATPTGVFDMSSRTITLSCATEGAKISYRIGVTGEWNVYTSPITVGRNCTVYAQATFEGYNDSDVAEITVTGFPDAMPMPVITFLDGIVTITCERPDAAIRYTLDKTVPTMESTLYEGPFNLSYNATVWAIAYIPNSDIEPSEISELVVDFYQTSAPIGHFDGATGMLTFECETPGATISYSFNLENGWTVYTGPIAIETNCTVYAKAEVDGYRPSEIIDIEVGLFKCESVNISYNGRFVSMHTDEPETEIRYSVDGSDPVIGSVYSGEFDVKNLCTVKAVVLKEGYQNSEISEYLIKYYADEYHAETASEGMLESCFGWNIPETFDEFRVEGYLNDADFTLLKTLKGLRHLHLEKVKEAKIPDAAFLNSGLVSISMPSELVQYGDNILSGCTNLCGIIWNSTTMDIEGRLIQNLANPNVLIYVSSGIRVENAETQNIIESGRAESIILQDAYPFDVVREFTADEISYSRNFTKETVINQCGGWETITLPFAPQQISHERAGKIVPFAGWDENIDGDKPFWLYSSTPDGWEAAKEIEACKPYIISMPNNKEYIEAFNLSGRVTFSAKDVTLIPDEIDPKITPWKYDTQLVGTFMPVAGANVRSLNAEDYDGQLPGSTFVADSKTFPFGAYVTGTLRKSIPVFGAWSGVLMLSGNDEGLMVETPAPGILRITSDRKRRVDVMTVTGIVIRTLHLMGGETVSIEGLTRDLYIVGGKKVMVK